MSTRAVSSLPSVVDVGLLRLLLVAREPRTIESLALELGVPVRNVRPELERLRRAGCRLEEHPQRGVRLIESGLGAWTDFLEQVGGRGRKVVCYRSTSSTQDVARGLVESRGRAADGALVTADEQTAGRGRLGRRWVAPAGSGIAMSLVTHVDESLGAVDRLTFAASVAVARVVERFVRGDARVKIKWPNDVQVDGRKVAGILVETLLAPGTQDGRSAVVGIGVNCSVRPGDMPEDIRDRVTSLAMCGGGADRLLVLAELVRELDACLAAPPGGAASADATALLPEWRRRCAMVGQRLTFQTHGRVLEGEVVDLDPRLGLIVRTGRGMLAHLPAETTSVVV